MWPWHRWLVKLFYKCHCCESRAAWRVIDNFPKPFYVCDECKEDLEMLGAVREEQ